MEEHERAIELKKVRNPLFFRNKHEHQHDLIQLSSIYWYIVTINTSSFDDIKRGITTTWPPSKRLENSQYFMLSMHNICVLIYDILRGHAKFSGPSPDLFNCFTRGCPFRSWSNFGCCIFLLDTILVYEAWFFCFS